MMDEILKKSIEEIAEKEEAFQKTEFLKLPDIIEIISIFYFLECSPLIQSIDDITRDGVQITYSRKSTFKLFSQQEMIKRFNDFISRKIVRGEL